jgi:hypothetical protein
MVLDSFERVPASRCTLEELHMSALGVSRRRFLTGTGALAGVELGGASLQFPFFAFSLGSQVCFAKILYALKIARIPVATDVPSGLSLHPPSAKILSRGNPRAVYLYI